MTPQPKRVLFSRPLNDDEEGLFSVVRDSASKAGARVSGIEDYFQPSAAFMDIIAAHDVLVCDVTTNNPNVMFEIGYAQALGKPVIYLAKSTRDIPFDISRQRFLIYGLLSSHESRVAALTEILKRAFDDPSKFVAALPAKPEAQQVFVSYSHRDRDYLLRLIVHLKPLQRAGQIDVWSDTRIEPGEQWKEEIERALSRAAVAVLLVSADFLASDFIVNDELPTILRNAASKGVQIIPVILKPCRFTRDENLKGFQAINDPARPVIALSEAEQELIYDSVATAIERIMDRTRPS